MGAYPRNAPPLRAVPPPLAPESCPACQSTSISTTSKIPDSSSYWRCTTCGEIWNDSRRDSVRNGGSKWR
jgi:transposase-like protein